MMGVHLTKRIWGITVLKTLRDARVVFFYAVTEILTLEKLVMIQIKRPVTAVLNLAKLKMVGKFPTKLQEESHR